MSSESIATPWPAAGYGKWGAGCFPSGIMFSSAKLELHLQITLSRSHSLT